MQTILLYNMYIKYCMAFPLAIFHGVANLSNIFARIRKSTLCNTYLLKIWLEQGLCKKIILHKLSIFLSYPHHMLDDNKQTNKQKSKYAMKIFFSSCVCVFGMIWYVGRNLAFPTCEPNKDTFWCRKKIWLLRLRFF